MSYSSFRQHDILSPYMFNRKIFMRPDYGWKVWGKRMVIIFAGYVTTGFGLKTGTMS